MVSRLIKSSGNNNKVPEEDPNDLTVFNGIVVGLQTAADCYYMTVQIGKPRITPLTPEEEEDPKRAAEFNRKVKAADAFMADLGLGQVEVRYLNLD